MIIILITIIRNFIEITLQHGYFPINFLHIFRVRFQKNSPGGLLLFKLKSLLKHSSILLVRFKQKTLKTDHVGSRTSEGFLEIT